MSDGINKATLLGNLGTGPELREATSGQSVCNFMVATNSTHGRGEYRKEKTEWHRVVVWGRLAEMCVEFLTKGSRVWLEGHLQTREWEDRQGSLKKKTEIVVSRIIFLDKRTS